MKFYLKAMYLHKIYRKLEMSLHLTFFSYRFNTYWHISCNCHWYILLCDTNTNLAPSYGVLEVIQILFVCLFNVFKSKSIFSVSTLIMLLIIVFFG